MGCPEHGAYANCGYGESDLAYAPNDPKRPGYAESMFDRADDLRDMID